MRVADWESVTSTMKFETWWLVAAKVCVNPCEIVAVIYGCVISENLYKLIRLICVKVVAVLYYAILYCLLVNQ